MYGPCRSTIGGGQALTSPRRHSLGKPLPYQLADTEQANLEAINLYSAQSAQVIKFIKFIKFQVHKVREFNPRLDKLYKLDELLTLQTVCFAR